MGRVKEKRKIRSSLNRISVSKRWASSKQLEEPSASNATKFSRENIDIEIPVRIDYDIERPGTSNEVGLIQIDENRHMQLSPEPSSNSEDEAPVNKRPTGFDLVSSYNPQINDCDDNAPSYCLVDLANLINFLEGMPCKFCLDVNTHVFASKIKGFAREISVHCQTCGETLIFETSKKIRDASVKTRPPFDVNRRMTKTFLSLGKGHTGLQLFCMGLNMPCIHHSAYDKQINLIIDTAKQHVLESLKRARTEVVKVYTDVGLVEELDLQKPLDITVSYDGSWQKRGFTSKYGIGCVIEVITGLVIDFEVISKYCRVCQAKASQLGEDSQEYEAWVLDHWLTCQSNFEGSSPAMEAEAAERLWKRSTDIGFRYTSMVSDGDSKTHDHLTSLQIYGSDVNIEKQECVNHIAKRLGTGLRNLVKDFSKKHAKDSSKKKVTLGGKNYGSLKGGTINKLTQYYRNAVTSNLGDPKAMKTSIFATLDHCRSTDDKPRHDNCPAGKDSWCFFQRDKANDREPRKHKDAIKTPINQTVYDNVLPLYRRLSSDVLLSRCSSGQTQNANEALHGLIWSKCPKTMFFSKNKVDGLVSEGVSLFNEGYLITMTSLYSSTGISPGSYTVHHAKEKDARRLKLRKKRNTNKYKKYRKMVKTAQLIEEEKKIEKEGMSYGAGEF